MPSYRRLQQYAIAISILSVIYNGAEGGISIGFGSESSSRSFIFFGIQSMIEVASAVIVLWRFRKVAMPGEESMSVLGARELRIEKLASGIIGSLLLALALATEVSAIVALALHQEPDASNATLIISASALVIMILIWLPKRYLARMLNSSVMQGEATCSLSCIQITIVLFVGSLVFRLWRGGWWVDSATSLLLGILFGWEGVKMIRWVLNPAFDGGCCDHCHKNVVEDQAGAAELGEQYRDLCECCLEKNECRESDECKCTETSSVEPGCCKPSKADGSKCCTHNIISGPRLNAAVEQPCSANVAADTLCSRNAAVCEGEPATETCCDMTTNPACSDNRVNEGAFMIRVFTTL